eukprot:m.236822 g.236822  ORF g.236822 m.236822 type:complete len:199 (+) comp40142_c0_seq3:94-690(+)
MTSLSKTILRPLTAEDVAAIEAMCQDVSKGLDYLPGVIESWIAEKNVRTLGMEQNGILVAVQAAHVVDDGQTAVLMGLRVHPDHQRRGIASLMKAVELVCRELSTVKRIRVSIVSYNQASARLTTDWKQICSSVTNEFLLKLIKAGNLVLGICVLSSRRGLVDIRPPARVSFSRRIVALPLPNVQNTCFADFLNMTSH